MNIQEKSIRQRAKYHNDPEYREHIKQKMRDRRAKCKETHGVSHMTWYRKNNVTLHMKFLLRLARRRAEVNVSPEYMSEVYRSQEGKCGLCGAELVWGRGKVMPHSMTIDRIDPSLPYTEGNVWLLGHLCNSMKRTMSLYEFVKFCEKIAARFKL